MRTDRLSQQSTQFSAVFSVGNIIRFGVAQWTPLIGGINKIKNIRYLSWEDMQQQCLTSEHLKIRFPPSPRQCVRPIQMRTLLPADSITGKYLLSIRVAKAGWGLRVVRESKAIARLISSLTKDVTRLKIKGNSYYGWIVL